MRLVSSVALLALVLSSSCASRTVAQRMPASQPSRPTPELTRASASRMSTQQLAQLLLPDEPAGRFVSHELGAPGPHNDPLLAVNFFARPTALGDDLCQRDAVRASLQPDDTWLPGGVQQDVAVKFVRAYPKVQIAAAPRCRFKQGGYFAWVQPEGVDELAPQALRRLVALQAVAKAGGQLPKVTCASEAGDNACTPPLRTVIASLPLDRIYIIQPDQSGWAFSVMPSGPGQLYWDVRIPPEGIFDEPIVMRWGRPAPF